jgi:ADP-dependent NAD(P)H-hydrate dehydratase / NAD(P)H-hydrate epimerase
MYFLNETIQVFSMIPVLTTSQMRAIDKQAIAGDVTVGYSYMQTAAAGLYKEVVEYLKSPGRDEVAIVCGTGNNGGDGYELGSILLDKGYKPMCFGLCDGDDLTGEARRAYDSYSSRGGNFLRLDEVEDLEAFGEFAVIVDAILGTGLVGSPRGLAAKVIELINSAGKPVVSVDTPSGLNNDTGEAGDPIVHATATVTMGLPKLGQFFFPGKKSVGNLHVHDLGYPQDIVARNQSGIFAPAANDLKALLPPRKPSGSKFDHGQALVLAGSRGMTGSATLVCQSALRTGCGMVRLAAPASALPVLAAKLTETIIQGIADTAEGCFAPAGLDAVLALADGMQAVCIGPGVSHCAETGRLVRDAVAKIRLPIVLDADGINAFKGDAKALANRQADLVITPHEGEWVRLFEALPPQPESRIKSLVKIAREFSMTIIYKGNPTIVATAQGAAYIVGLGNSGMATAGSGDVLSGIIVSLIAQGGLPSDAAVLGASLHGLAGQAAAERFGEYSMVAGDIVDCIHDAIVPLAENRVPVFLP